MDESEQVSSFDRWEFYGWASGSGLVFGSTFGVDMQYREWTWRVVRSFSVFILFIYIFSLVFQVRE